MPANWLYAIVSVIIVSLVSLVGITVLSVSEPKLRRAVFILVSLAVGALFGDVFIHLLPQAFEKSSTGVATGLYVLAGIFVMFVLEKFLRWRHEHGLESPDPILPVGYMNLIGDGVHNLLDGLLIGASYLAGLPIGLATTLAVLLHEIPQEIGDFGILLHAGFEKKKAISINLLSASLAIAGVLLALLAGSAAEPFSTAMLPITAGSFIYIAGSDLVPELHKEVRPSKSAAQLIALSAGTGLMYLLTLFD